jgi:hypothetical protein
VKAGDWSMGVMVAIAIVVKQMNAPEAIPQP